MDCTVGYAGLASRILQETGPDGVLIGIDRDQIAVDAARDRLHRCEGRVYLRQGNFVDLKTHVSFFGFPAVDGVVFDLGVSGNILRIVNGESVGSVVSGDVTPPRG